MSSPINELIDNNLLLTTFHLMDKGMALSRKEENLFNQQVFAQFFHGYDLVESLLEQRIPFDDKYIAWAALSNIQRFQEVFNLFNEEQHEASRKSWGNSQPLLRQYLHSKLHNGQLGQMLYTGWFKLIEEIANDNVFYGKGTTVVVHPEEHAFLHQRIIVPAQELKGHMFAGISESEYMKAITLLESLKKRTYREYGIDAKKKVYHHTFSFGNYIDPLVKQMRKEKWYASTSVTHPDINQSIAQLLSKNQEELVSTQCLEMMHQIMDCYHHIKQQKAQLSEEQGFYVRKLYHEQLPHIVENYLALPKECRQQVVASQGKTASEVFQNTMADIRDIFEGLLQQVTQEKLVELSTSQRYFNNIKKSM